MPCAKLEIARLRKEAFFAAHGRTAAAAASGVGTEPTGREPNAAEELVPAVDVKKDMVDSKSDMASPELDDFGFAPASRNLDPAAEHHIAAAYYASAADGPELLMQAAAPHADDGDAAPEHVLPPPLDAVPR